MGGLGNQLFQIFTTIAYGIRTKRKILFPYTETLEIGISRNTYWSNFLSSIKIMTNFRGDNMPTNEDLLSLPQLRERGHHYQEIPVDIPYPAISLFGYFQSPHYFEAEKKTIFSLIKLAESQQHLRSEHSDLLSDHYVRISLHFRLGDYKANQASHPIMTYEYYDRALMHMLMFCKIDRPVRVLYFCEKDDNDVVCQTIDRLSDKYYGFQFVKVDDAIDDWKQMLIMSLCHHNIIANSSFSWWGAYFNSGTTTTTTTNNNNTSNTTNNNNDDKIVCYPSTWFGPALADKDTKDLFPTTWQSISATPSN